MKIENIEKIKIQSEIFPEEKEFPFTRITLICGNNLKKISALDRILEEKVNGKISHFISHGTVEINGNPLDSCDINTENINYVYYPENDRSPRHQWEYTQLFANTDDQNIFRTDSNIILNGFLIEIKKGNIKPEDFSIIFFDDEGNDYIVKAKKTGFIPHRPPGFFTTLNEQLRILVGILIKYNYEIKTN